MSTIFHRITTSTPPITPTTIRRALTRLYTTTTQTIHKRPVIATYTILSSTALIYALSTDTTTISQSFHTHITPLQNRYFNHRHHARKALLLSSVYGKTVETGVSDGNNIDAIPIQNVKQLIYYIGTDTATDYNLPQIHRHVRDTGMSEAMLELHECGDNNVQYLQSLPANSVSSVISTFTLSRTQYASTPSAQQSLLTEIQRVLRPNGRYYFVEYTRNDRLSGVQWLYNPIVRFFTRCSVNTDIAGTVLSQPQFSSVYMEQWPHWVRRGDERAGIVEVKRDENSGVISGVHGVRPVIAGVAVKAK